MLCSHVYIIMQSHPHVSVDCDNLICIVICGGHISNKLLLFGLVTSTRLSLSELSIVLEKFWYGSGMLCLFIAVLMKSRAGIIF